jgi:hypothetical protein
VPDVIEELKKRAAVPFPDEGRAGMKRSGVATLAVVAIELLPPVRLIGAVDARAGRSGGILGSE